MAEAKPAFEWRDFPSGNALADALADAVAARLDAAVAARGRASLALSGGRTPTRFFAALSKRPVAWDKVTVTLVDERCVPVASDRSNARLVTHHLLQNQAARARFVPLFDGSSSPDTAAVKASEAIDALPMPLDVAILGMGQDGHTASFFPDAAGIADILSGARGAPVIAVDAPSAGEPRLSLALPVLAEARFLALHIEGLAKKTVFEAAMADHPATPLPVRAVIDRAATPPDIFWSP